jgi:formate-dependent nitrite reductase membrane component NrfD
MTLLGNGSGDNGGGRPSAGNVTEVTRDGLRNVISDRQAHTGAYGQRKRKRRGDPNAMVPEATFTSYYGRPVVKASPWTNDIPAYLFLGGLMAGSSLVAAGADLSGRPVTRRTCHTAALVALLGSGYALIHDLGRPERFYNMLRVARPTSPMSVGTWILTAYGPFAGAAAAAEVVPFVPGLPRWVRTVAPHAGRASGLVAAAVAPGVAAYTSVLLADTSSPSWKEAWRQLPFVFTAGAAASGAGIALLAPVEESGPARRLGVGAAIVELTVTEWMERSMGLAGEPYRLGTAGKLGRAAKAFLAGGTALALAGRRSRALSALAGLCLVSGGACTRFAVFEAGQASAKDPRYVVIPQRERLEKGRQAAERTIP